MSAIPDVIRPDQKFRTLRETLDWVAHVSWERSRSSIEYGALPADMMEAALDVSRDNIRQTRERLRTSSIADMRRMGAVVDPDEGLPADWRFIFAEGPLQ